MLSLDAIHDAWNARNYKSLKRLLRFTLQQCVMAENKNEGNDQQMQQQKQEKNNSLQVQEELIDMYPLYNLLSPAQFNQLQQRYMSQSTFSSISDNQTNDNNGRAAASDASSITSAAIPVGGIDPSKQLPGLAPISPTGATTNDKIESGNRNEMRERRDIDVLLLLEIMNAVQPFHDTSKSPIQPSWFKRIPDNEKQAIKNNLTLEEREEIAYLCDRIIMFWMRNLELFYPELHQNNGQGYRQMFGPVIKLRGDMINDSIHFLRDPKVSDRSLKERMAFLINKGVTLAELSEALMRVGIKVDVAEMRKASRLLREDMVGNAIQFFHSDKVAKLTLKEKVTFLYQKGLTSDEIEEVRDRLGLPTIPDLI